MASTLAKSMLNASPSANKLPDFLSHLLTKKPGLQNGTEFVARIDRFHCIHLG